ncbi:MAG TPA: hypothetical protein PK360_16565 [bacterium]|nr:hypothetical protein [bacterium]
MTDIQSASLSASCCFIRQAFHAAILLPTYYFVFTEYSLNCQQHLGPRPGEWISPPRG